MREKRATTTPTIPDFHIPDAEVLAPIGADLVCAWEPNIEGEPYRTICGADRHVTDHDAAVYPMVVQFADGTIADDSEFSSPGIYVCQGDRDCLNQLNVDQARELAAALLECAAEVDRWVQR